MTFAGWKTRLAGWGNYAHESCTLHRPASVSECQGLLASNSQSHWIARGCGRSYGDSAVNAEGGVCLQTGLSHFLNWQDDTGILECESGVTLAEMMQFLLPRGWFVHTTPGTKFVTLGGAIAADVHGKNHHFDGSFAAGVLSFELLLANGSIITCSREQHAEIFWATLGGMGLTGLILRVRLQLRRVPSAYVKCRYLKCPNIETTLRELEATGEDYRYSVAWIDCLTGGAAQGRSVLMLANDATAEQLPASLAQRPWSWPNKREKSVPAWVPNGLVNRWSVAAFNGLYYHSHAKRTCPVDYNTFFYPLDAIHSWNRLYGPRGFIQYQILFPPENTSPGLKATLDLINRAGAVSFLCVLKKCGAASGGLLSYLKPGFTLAMDLPNQGTATLRLLADLERIALEYQGRLYLAKDATMQRTTFERMYPELAEFQRVKRGIDPDCLFQSSQSRRLGITP